MKKSNIVVSLAALVFSLSLNAAAPVNDPDHLVKRSADFSVESNHHDGKTNYNRSKTWVEKGYGRVKNDAEKGIDATKNTYKKTKDGAVTLYDGAKVTTEKGVDTTKKGYHKAKKGATSIFVKIKSGIHDGAQWLSKKTA